MQMDADPLSSAVLGATNVDSSDSTPTDSPQVDRRVLPPRSASFRLHNSSARRNSTPMVIDTGNISSNSSSSSSSSSGLSSTVYSSTPTSSFRRVNSKTAGSTTHSHSHRYAPAFNTCRCLNITFTITSQPPLSEGEITAIESLFGSAEGSSNNASSGRSTSLFQHASSSSSATASAAAPLFADGYFCGRLVSHTSVHEELVSSRPHSTHAQWQILRCLCCHMDVFALSAAHRLVVANLRAYQGDDARRLRETEAYSKAFSIVIRGAEKAHPLPVLQQQAGAATSATEPSVESPQNAIQSIRSCLDQSLLSSLNSERVAMEARLSQLRAIELQRFEDIEQRLRREHAALVAAVEKEGQEGPLAKLLAAAPSLPQTAESTVVNRSSPRHAQVEAASAAASPRSRTRIVDLLQMQSAGVSDAPSAEHSRQESDTADAPHTLGGSGSGSGSNSATAASPDAAARAKASASWTAGTKSPSAPTSAAAAAAAELQAQQAANVQAIPLDLDSDIPVAVTGSAPRANSALSQRTATPITAVGSATRTATPIGLGGSGNRTTTPIALAGSAPRASITPVTVPPPTLSVATSEQSPELFPASPSPSPRLPPATKPSAVAALPSSLRTQTEHVVLQPFDASPAFSSASTSTTSPATAASGAAAASSAAGAAAIEHLDDFSLPASSQPAHAGEGGSSGRSSNASSPSAASPVGVDDSAALFELDEDVAAREARRKARMDDTGMSPSFHAMQRRSSESLISVASEAEEDGEDAEDEGELSASDEDATVTVLAPTSKASRLLGLSGGATNATVAAPTTILRARTSSASAAPHVIPMSLPIAIPAQLRNAPVAPTANAGSTATAAATNGTHEPQQRAQQQQQQGSGLARSLKERASHVGSHAHPQVAQPPPRISSYWSSSDEEDNASGEDEDDSKLPPHTLVDASYARSLRAGELPSLGKVRDLVASSRRSVITGSTASTSSASSSASPVPITSSVSPLPLATPAQLAASLPRVIGSLGAGKVIHAPLTSSSATGESDALSSNTPQPSAIASRPQTLGFVPTQAPPPKTAHARGGPSSRNPSNVKA